MNWEKIRQECPKAFREAQDSVKEIDTPGHQDYGCPEEVRDLYDFFDEHDIFIEISADSINSWNYDLFKLTETSFHPIYSKGYMYLNRKEAEQAAFEKAFELLEKKFANN
jgi:hypothetical protein